MFRSVLDHPQGDIFFTSVTKDKLFRFVEACLLLCFVLILRTLPSVVVVVVVAAVVVLLLLTTTPGGSWSVQQFYSTPVYPRPSPSNQQFSSSLGLLLPGPSTLTWVSLLVLFYMASILLFFW